MSCTPQAQHSWTDKALLCCPQVPAWFGVQHSRTLSLVGCILCFVSLVAYCSYHVSVST
jgi:hypothetical protein